MSSVLDLDKDSDLVGAILTLNMTRRVGKESSQMND